MEEGNGGEDAFVGTRCARLDELLSCSFPTVPPSSILPPSASLCLAHHRHAVGDGTSPAYTSAHEGCRDEAIRDAESCAGEREERKVQR